MSFSHFVDGYLDCALWAATEDDDNGTPLDERCNSNDWTDQAKAKATADCLDFWNVNSHLWLGGDNHWTRNGDSYAGHDFYLTRNGHGAGFWDRGEGELGETLTQAAKVYSETHIWADDDNKLHLE